MTVLRAGFRELQDLLLFSLRETLQLLTHVALHQRTLCNTARLFRKANRLVWHRLPQVVMVVRPQVHCDCNDYIAVP